MNDEFDELMRQLSRYQATVDGAFLHGLLTGCATIPEIDSESLFTAIGGDQPLPEAIVEAVLDTIGLLAGELSNESFEAGFDSRREGDAQRWLKGYLKAVEIHERDWRELNEIHTDAAACLLQLNTLSNPKLHRELELDMDLPGPKELERNPELASTLVSNIYAEFHASLDDDLDPGYDESFSWLDYGDDELPEMGASLLMDIVVSSDDTLPLQVVLEGARRGDAMVALLRQHLETEANWGDEADEGDSWALLHAIFILGLIPGEASARTLLNAFRRLTLDERDDRADWLSSSWPALCRNKTDFTTAPLRRIAESREAGWYPRAEAIDCVLAAAAANGAEALEQGVDWVATMCADTSEDNEFRVVAGYKLLDFPRKRHRPVMEELVDLQQPESFVARAYDKDDIQRAFDTGDDPEWERFADPWQFYDPDEIKSRQARWRRETAERYCPVPIGPAQPYKRESSKTGRNDPCPCGSGKKFKKCCLNVSG
ncbi:MAG TPA: UPF0149 family protein [Woeseiaceae bacterium]